MASIPTPTVAYETTVGATDGLPPRVFHAGPYHDITDHGAAMDGTTDDSAALVSALEKSASDGGAAYIPKGTTFVSGWRAVDMTSVMNGATLVGHGADSVVTGDDLPFGFFEQGFSDITFANFRIDAGANSASRCIYTPDDHSTTMQDCVFENLWMHDAALTNCRFSTDGTGTHAVINSCSVWGAVDYNGIRLSNINGVIECYDILAWDNGLTTPENAGCGIQPSGEYAIVDGFMLVNNMFGLQTTDSNIDCTIKNGYILNSHKTGFGAVGDIGSGTTTVDNVVSSGSGGHGFVFSANDYDIGTVWAYNSCTDAAIDASYREAGIEYRHGANINATELRVCATKNGAPGITQTGTPLADGSVETLIASSNAGGTFGTASDVTYGETLSQTCNTPNAVDTVESTVNPYHHYDGSDWERAALFYYDDVEWIPVTSHRFR